MKKVILTILIMFVVSWSCSTVFAQGGGGQGKRTEKVGEKDRGQQADADESSEQDAQIRQRERERERQRGQLEMRRKERQKSRETRRKAREKSESGQDVNRPAGKFGKTKSEGKGKKAEKDTSKGKGPQQQLKALDAQMVREEAKHLRRVARLNRIRALAVGEGSTKIVERVGKLLGKEQQRYDLKRQLMR